MTFDEELRRAFDTLRDRLQHEIAREVRRATDELVRSAQDRAVATGTPQSAAPAAASEPLLDGIRAIGAGRSLSEILETSVSFAAREAGRAAILLVRGGRLYGWRFAGFGPEFEAGAVDISHVDGGIVADAVRTAETAPGNGARQSSPPSFAGLTADRESVAVPMVMAGQVVAVLYADQGMSGPPSSAWRSTVEVLASHAARSLEALTAVKAARAMTETPPDANGNAAADSGDAGDEDTAARRYARLLVSEIKLYHEPEVIAGRRQRDLATRLGGEIARARVLYEQRVAAELRQRADYFHDELVRTLAGGDASLLEVRT